MPAPAPALARRRGARLAAVAACALSLAALVAGCGGESGRPLGRPDEETAALRDAANAICREAGNPLAHLDAAAEGGWRSGGGGPAVAERQRVAQRELAALEPDAPAWMDERYAAFVAARDEFVRFARTVEPPGAGGVNFVQVFVDENPEHVRLADELGLDDCAR